MTDRPKRRPVVVPTHRRFRTWELLLLVAVLLLVVFGGYELVERSLIAGKVSMETLHRIHLARGIIASLIFTTFIGLYLYRRLPIPGAGGVRPTSEQLLDRDERRRLYARWFVRMRWIAISVSLLLIVVSVPILSFLPQRTLFPLAGWWVLLLVANIVFERRVEKGRDFTRQILVQGCIDLLVLTGFLNASGGLENPLYLFYLFHVILGGILLPRRQAAGLTLVASVLFLLLAFGEYFHFLPHYTNALFPHEGVPAAAAEQAAVGEAAHDHGGHAAHDFFFVLGRILPFLAVLLLIAYFTAVIMERVRRGEYELEDVAHRAMFDRRRLEGVVDASGLGMMQVGPRSEVRWFSRRIGDWFGWKQDIVGDACPLLAGPERCVRCIAQTTAETGQVLEAERSQSLEGGGARYFRHTTSPVRDRDGTVVQVVEVVEDVTARKALEAEAVHAGKLSVLGRMAAGIAHEIGNPLSSLSTRLSLLERRREPEFVHESVGVLRAQIERIKRIVHGVSHFARLRREDWTLWDLNELAEEAVAVVELDRRCKNVAFSLELAEASPQVRGVRDQILQVTVNLLLNAVEALPEGGEVRLETRELADRVELAVADTGIGMDDATRAHLFEPFFTTKSEGTGLGLSISYSLIHAHGGRIEVDSSAAQGSRFTVVLPLVPEVGGRGVAAR